MIMMRTSEYSSFSCSFLQWAIDASMLRHNCNSAGTATFTLSVTVLSSAVHIRSPALEDFCRITSNHLLEARQKIKEIW